MSACAVGALDFECLDLVLSFLVCRYIFEMSCSHINVTGSISRSQEQKTGRYILFVDRLPSIKRQSYYLYIYIQSHFF